MNHTPLPWTYRKAYYSPEWREDNNVIETRDPQPSKIKDFDPIQETVCHMARPEDAQFICRAVNSYDKLLEVAEMFLRMNENIQSMSSDDLDELKTALHFIAPQIRDAIATAKN